MYLLEKVGFQWLELFSSTATLYTKSPEYTLGYSWLICFILGGFILSCIIFTYLHYTLSQINIYHIFFRCNNIYFIVSTEKKCRDYGRFSAKRHVHILQQLMPFKDLCLLINWPNWLPAGFRKYSWKYIGVLKIVDFLCHLLAILQFNYRKI